VHPIVGALIESNITTISELRSISLYDGFALFDILVTKRIKEDKAQTITEAKNKVRHG
jgi:hypothetical protein